MRHLDANKEKKKSRELFELIYSSVVDIPSLKSFFASSSEYFSFVHRFDPTLEKLHNYVSTHVGKTDSDFRWVSVCERSFFLHTVWDAQQR